VNTMGNYATFDALFGKKCEIFIFLIIISTLHSPVCYTAGEFTRFLTLDDCSIRVGLICCNFY